LKLADSFSKLTDSTRDLHCSLLPTTFMVSVNCNLFATYEEFLRHSTVSLFILGSIRQPLELHASKGYELLYRMVTAE